MLSFALSGVVQAVVTKGEMGRLRPDAGWRSIALAGGLGAASFFLFLPGGGGGSFVVAAAFLLADLIVLPVVDIYGKYYGPRIAALLFALFCVVMTAAGYAVEIVFGLLGLVPAEHRAPMLEAHPSWNYTTVLNLVALALSAVLVWRFLRTGERAMLRMMAAPAQPDHSYQHHHHPST